MYQKDVFLRITSLAAALAASFPAWGQATDANAVATMDPVVITGVAPSAPLTFTTDPQIPRQPLPASDGTDYLKTVPGFSAIRNGGTNGDPVLRGMFGSRLNLLTNGTSMPGACPARMDAPSSYISPENFDQLTVIKGPQTVLWGPGASAGTVKFDRDTPRFTEPGVRFDGSLLGGSFGRNDQAADLTVGNDKVYTRVTANHSHSQDYEDGDGNKVPSRWDKWNADVTLGFTPDADTLYELTAGTGDGEARYAGRGMDGSQFKRESLGLRFEKSNLGEVLDKVEAQVYYNYADHVMDNYTLRTPNPMSAMPMRMAADVDRATWGGRFASTWNLSRDVDVVTGLDFQQSRHRSRSGMGAVSIAASPGSGRGLLQYRPVRRSDLARRAGQPRHRRRARGLGLRQGLPPGRRRHDDAHAQSHRRRTPQRHAAQRVPALRAGPGNPAGHPLRRPGTRGAFPRLLGAVLAGSRAGRHVINAFSGVKPEKTTQLDFGAVPDGDGGRLVLGLRGLHRRLHPVQLHLGRHDGILVPGDQRGRQDRRRRTGRGLQDRAEQWKLGGTLAYAWGQNRSDGRALPQMPPLEAKLSAAYDDGTWSAGALWRIVAAQKRYALNRKATWSARTSAPAPASACSPSMAATRSTNRSSCRWAWTICSTRPTAST